MDNKYIYSIEASDPWGHPSVWTETYTADCQKDAVDCAQGYKVKHPTTNVRVVKIIAEV
jgi:hypothetical protein